MHPFEKKLSEQLVAYRRLMAHPVLLAVSGGADSMALLHGVDRMGLSRGVRVAHYQHGLRVNAERDALFVLQECRKRSVPIVVGYHKPVKSSEVALREARHSFLEAEQRRLGCKSIWSAHHLQDQLETFLMRLVRGSGISGLAGIPIERGVWFRPLLNFSKAEILTYVRDEGISYVEDETNASLRYTRNLVRHTVLPPLEAVATLHGGVDAFYARLEGMFAELRSTAFEQRVESSELLSRVTETEYFCRLPLERWSELDVGSKTLLVRALFERLLVEVPSRKRLEALLSAIDSQTSSFDVEGELRVLRSAGHLYFQTREQRLRPGPKFFKNKLRIESPELELEMDLDETVSAIPRTALPGDRIGGTKLKKHLHALGLPRPERRLWPLLVQPEGAVIWHALRSRPGVHLRRLGFPFAITAPQQDKA
ncbi:MAG: tRNA lysidine(34) synthetase TilS [Bdellovibrionales bacterium]|nr:tRNA lysidine(34) synthetase TilS [Bdellovibrionales bacterium]